MRSARTHAQHEVADIQEKLRSLQTKRDARAVVIEVENSRVRQLEVEVVQREQEVCSLKEQLDAASKVSAVAVETGTVAAKMGASSSGDRVEGDTVQLAEATRVKEALEKEPTEFAEYTDMKDKEMFEMKERMTAIKESLRQREAELNTIRAADKGEGARNVNFVEGLQNDAKEIEAAIEDRGEDGHDVLSGLKTALEASQKEVIEYKTWSERAETELKKLVEKLHSTEACLENERHEAKRATLKPTKAVADLKTLAREERLRANEALTRTLGAKRTLENALSSVCETELRLRFRLHEATDHVLKLKLAQAGMPEIGAILDEENERINFLQKRLGFVEESLRKARKVAENLAEKARWKVAETNGSRAYFNAKAVQLTAQGEQFKAECKNHEAKVEGVCAALERAESLVSSKEEGVVTLRHHAADLASELEAAGQAVKAGGKEMATAASKHEADAKDLRSALERVETSVAAKEEEIASLREQAAHHELQEA